MDDTKIFIVYKTLSYPGTVFDILLTKNVSLMKDYFKAQLTFFLFSVVREDLSNGKYSNVLLVKYCIFASLRQVEDCVGRSQILLIK